MMALLQYVYDCNGFDAATVVLMTRTVQVLCCIGALPVFCLPSQ